MRFLRWFSAIVVASALTACGSSPPISDAETTATSVPSITSVTVGPSGVPATSETIRSTSGPPTTKVSVPCTMGVPTRITWPDMAIDTTFETTGLDKSMPPDKNGKYPAAPPQDKMKMGWYGGRSQPGKGSGTVLILGHTWPDNTAVFKEDFDQKLQLGSEFTIYTDTGGMCRYRVSLKLTGLDKSSDAYPAAAAKYKLYATTGPERVVGTTCTGKFDNSVRSHVNNSVFVADRAN